MIAIESHEFIEPLFPAAAHQLYRLDNTIGQSMTIINYPFKQLADNCNDAINGVQQ